MKENMFLQKDNGDFENKVMFFNIFRGWLMEKYIARERDLISLLKQARRRERRGGGERMASEGEESNLCIQN